MLHAGTARREDGAVVSTGGRRCSRSWVPAPTWMQKIAARNADEAVDTQAKGAVDAVIGGMLQKSIATRRAAVKDLGDAIGFVGEAIRQ